MEPSQSKYIKVEESSIHGTGVFARINIPKGKKVIEYIGEKITKKESEKRSVSLIEKNQGSLTDGAVYIFELNKKHDIDGNITEGCISMQHGSSCMADRDATCMITHNGSSPQTFFEQSYAMV